MKTKISFSDLKDRSLSIQKGEDGITFTADNYSTVGPFTQDEFDDIFDVMEQIHSNW